MRTLLIAILLLPMGAGETLIWSDISEDELASGMQVADQFGLIYNELEHLDMLLVEDDGTIGSYLLQIGGQIHADEVQPLHLDKSVPYIEADRVRSTVGVVRDGPTVMIVDTGLDSAHPDFQSGNVAANVQPDRTGGIIVGSLNAVPVTDLSGHGTHVAGIVGGDAASLGAQASNQGKYEGAYSLGRLISYQASTTNENPEEIGVASSAALESFDWAISNKDTYQIRVVTNSWGQKGDLEPGHPITMATKRLYLNGMTVFYSAGNDGADGPGLNMQCLAPWVLCVAAGGTDGSRMSHSSYGEGEKPYDHPDLTAPGLQITAAQTLAEMGVTDVTSLLGGGTPESSLYTKKTGTSMAAPHAAAVAGLILAANPNLSPDQVMDILVATTKPMADPAEKIGSGYIHAREAYNLAVSTEGNLDQFMALQEVKYAGPASGDDAYANDAFSVGYDSELKGGAVLLGEKNEQWAFTAPVVLVLTSIALLSVLLAWKRGRPAVAHTQTQSLPETGQTEEPL